MNKRKKRTDNTNRNVLRVVGYVEGKDLLGLIVPSEDKYFWHLNHVIAMKRHPATPKKIRITIEELKDEAGNV